jgi:hypothetical protein
MLAEKACCYWGGGTNCEGEVELEEVSAKVNGKDTVVNYKCEKKKINLF